MIRLTRLNGTELALNPDLIHRAEETPDTVLTLIDGTRYVVVEGLEVLIDRIVAYRARVIARAGLLARDEQGLTDPGDRPDDPDDPDDRLEGADVVRLRTRRA